MLVTGSVLCVLALVPRLGTDLVLVGALLVLTLTGVLTADEALAGFSNPGLITIAALFIIAAAVRTSGGVDLVVDRILGRPTGHRRALLRLMLPVTRFRFPQQHAGGGRHDSRGQPVDAKAAPARIRLHDSPQLRVDPGGHAHADRG
ncbi:MAG: SLC13 family permease [Pseudomonadales bacterium]